jgi:hypothetical protein
MASTQTQSSLIPVFTPPLDIFASAMDYLIHAAQRGLLFWDVMRRRGNRYRHHLAEPAPNALGYAARRRTAALPKA